MQAYWYVIFCLAGISLVGFVLTAWDKWQAKRGGWRIPEKTLLGLAVIGGGPGVYLAMQLFRHKTRHWQFSIGVPVIMVAQIIGVCYFFRG